MFTGLIEYVGSVLQVRPVANAKELRVDVGLLTEGLRLGQSLALDGACQTVTAVDGRQASFDVIPQTLSITTLAEFTPGRRVNLERPITLNAPLGGHLVTGHVDGLASLRRWSIQGQSKIAHFQANSKLTDFMVAKGSVSVNGVSLTIAELTETTFSVALIPTTLSSTNLGQLQPGQKANIETDLIGKYVAKFIAADKKWQITINTLKEHGFA